MVTLERLGCDGNGASVGRLAHTCGIGVGTVILYSKRVVEAIMSLEEEFMQGRFPHLVNLPKRKISPRHMQIQPESNLHFSKLNSPLRRKPRMLNFS